MVRIYMNEIYHRLKDTDLVSAKLTQLLPLMSLYTQAQCCQWLSGSHGDNHG